MTKKEYAVTYVLLAIAFVGVYIAILCLAFGSPQTQEEYAECLSEERFGIVEVINDTAVIIYDKETKVQYLFYEKDNYSGITVLLDKDGKPLLYQGEKNANS